MPAPAKKQKRMTVSSSYSHEVNLEDHLTAEGSSDSTQSSTSYVRYIPSLRDAIISENHPTKAVESASLSSLRLPNVSYKVSYETKASRGISNLQMEAIILAGHTHTMFHQGICNAFLLGDGAGVGKGREISGIIMDNYYHKRKKAIWMSKNTSLFANAADDFNDINFSSKEHLIDFSKCVKGSNLVIGKGSCLFVTYSTFLRNFDTKIKAIIAWLGSDFDGPIVLDESHCLKNAQTKAAEAIAVLDKKFPKAKFVYSSATVAESVKGLGYLSRLKLWGPETAYPQGFKQFKAVIEDIGVIGMEAIAMELKTRGSYVARKLDFSNAKVSIIKIQPNLDDIKMYNSCVSTWNNMKAMLDKSKSENTLDGQAIYKFYWKEHQVFFKLLCLSFKVKPLIAAIKAHIQNRKSVIIGLQSTGFNLSSKRKHLTRKHLFSTLQAKMEQVADNFRKSGIAVGNIKDQISRLGLPPNSLDYIIDVLGPSNVTELTGRTGRFIKAGNFYTWSKIPHSKNKRIKQFMDGKTRICIISEACSTGISLHAARDAKNSLRRVHITLELPWTIEQVIQQCGRTLRSYQRSSPIYELYVVDIAGESRFGYGVAEKMCALGALTDGDRKYSINGLDFFSLNSIYTSDAVKYTLESIAKISKPMVVKSQNMKQILRGQQLNQFFKEAYRQLYPVGLLQKGSPPKLGNIKTLKPFLNRLLGVTLPMQNQIYGYFCEVFKKVVDTHKKAGVYEEGVIDLGDGELVKQKRISLADGSIVTTHGIRHDGGISFSRAKDIYHSSVDNKFYIGLFNKIPTAYLAIKELGTSKYSILFPFGMLSKKKDKPKLDQSFNIANIASVPPIWDFQYKFQDCYHKFHKIPCSKQDAGIHCAMGNRFQIRYVLTGMIWSNLPTIDAALRNSGIEAMQLVRCNVATTTGSISPSTTSTRLIGIQIADSKVDSVVRFLRKKK